MTSKGRFAVELTDIDVDAEVDVAQRLVGPDSTFLGKPCDEVVWEAINTAYTNARAQHGLTSSYATLPLAARVSSIDLKYTAYHIERRRLRFVLSINEQIGTPKAFAATTGGYHCIIATEQRYRYVDDEIHAFTAVKETFFEAAFGLGLIADEVRKLEGEITLRDSPLSLVHRPLRGFSPPAQT